MWIAVIAVLIVGGFLLLGNRQQATQPGGEDVGGGPGVLPDSKRILSLFRMGNMTIATSRVTAQIPMP